MLLVRLLLAGANLYLENNKLVRGSGDSYGHGDGSGSGHSLGKVNTTQERNPMLLLRLIMAGANFHLEKDKQGNGYGDGRGSGYGDGRGSGSGHSLGYGYGDGYGDGNGDGDGYGSGSGHSLGKVNTTPKRILCYSYD